MQSLPQIITRVLTVALLLAGCQQEMLIDGSAQDEANVLNLQGAIDQEYVTRADDSGFATGDRMGIYVIDYDGDVPGTLKDSKHRASNVLYTYNADDNSWSSSAKLYWKDAVTPIDIYGYYPGVEHIENPSEYRVEVSCWQNVMPSDGAVSNYEASDFLWGKVTKVAPTEDVIIVNYSHRMAGVKVQLVKGTGMDDSEWEAAEKTVQVDNTVRYAVIDLADGIPVPEGEVDNSIIMLPQSDDAYRAVIVPQTVAAGSSLLSVTIDGRTYTHRLTSDMVYNMGRLHNFTITVNKSEVSGDYACSLSYEGITDWVNDESTHNYESNAYVVIDVSEPGTLEQVISDKGIDPADIQNLKLTGNLTESDFQYIRDKMSGSLRRINLKEVKLVHVLGQSYWSNEQQCHIEEYFDDYLPNYAFNNMSYLRQVILPIDLKHIGCNAFTCVELTSTLSLPEGLTHIHEQAFYGATCNIELPYSLEYIGNAVFASNQVDGVLVTGEMRLTDNLKYVGNSAFWRARNFTGTFYLPSKLEYLGEGAFESCGTDLSGDIIIPSTITEIPESAFREMGFHHGTNLVMHDNVKKIGVEAFTDTKINNDFDWPANLEFISKGAFANTKVLKMNLSFPERLKKIGSGALSGTLVGGDLVIPENINILEGGSTWGYSGLFSGTLIESVTAGNNLLFCGEMVFSNCSQLKKVQFGKNIEYIGTDAFSGCSSLQLFTCLSEEPPMVYSNTFSGVYFDKCILQVPEKSVELYRNTAVWNQFQNITAYKELAFNIPEITALDKSTVREGIIRAEGPWEVTECPDWVTVTPSSGTGKAQVTVSVDAQAVGSATREGTIVFSLTGKDYTTYTTVRQVGADVGEDQTVILQEASAGAANAIPLFIVGDGYDAEDIASGKYLQDMMQQMEYFFSIEPMKTYRDYFTVSTAYAVSPESGIGGLTRFDSEYYGELFGDNDKVLDYAGTYGVGISGNESNSTVLVLLNTNATANSTTLYDGSGLAISWMGKSEDVYPYDQQGCVLHEAVGTAFGKLGPETITHLTFIEACTCPGCNKNEAYARAQRNGWWQNVSKTNKMKILPWYHLIFHEKYASIVDVYEGACGHSRGAYRSENQSVMGNAYVHYFNTISREILVRRIMECAGEEFSFEDFVAEDVIELPE